MVYTQAQLPKLKNLRRFALAIKSFPITGLGVIQYAEHLGYDDETINFLKLFSREMIFNSRSDFLNHCALLERMVKEEKRQPASFVHEVQED